VAGDAFEDRKHLSHKVEVGLAECFSPGLMGVTVENAKAVFENESKRGSTGLWYVQKNDHLQFDQVIFSNDAKQCSHDDSWSI
jgi:hypothetical protein